MAELLAAKGWLAAGSVSAQLRDALPDGYYVIPEPTVRGYPLDAIVVGPQAIFVLHLRDWAGDVIAVRRGPWRERANSGPEIAHPNPTDEAREATTAVREFLKDEFPRLSPPIRNYLVLTNPSVRLVAMGMGEPIAMTPDTIADAIASTGPADDGALADDELRQSLAIAIRERKLTTNQRAKKPFVFRSGDLLASGTTVWTFRAAVKHMDRHPEDGMYHLRNGTLAEWLASEGADDLAALAREVMRQRASDDRMALESFLLATGLVRRPRLIAKPALVNCGYVLSGEHAYRTLRLTKGGRGYLFGSLQPSHNWIRVEPRDFSGSPTRVMVSVNTESLPIDRVRSGGEIRVTSSASTAPIEIPVRVRVMGMPSRVNRFFVRPLAGLIVGGAIGGGLGHLLGSWGAFSAPWVTGVFGWGAGALGTAILIGLFWALLGAFRGFMQPLAWPVSYAVWRWLLRTIGWMAALALLAAVAMWVLSWAYPPAGGAISDAMRFTAIMVAPAFAVLPAVMGEIRSSRAETSTTTAPEERPRRRPLVTVVVCVALLFVLALSLRIFRPTIETVDVEASTATAQEWTEKGWVQLETGLNDLIDRVMLRLYDRRAPSGG